MAERNTENPEQTNTNTKSDELIDPQISQKLTIQQLTHLAVRLQGLL